jgi:hypothetical protein
VHTGRESGYLCGDGFVEDFDSPGHGRLYLNFEIKKRGKSVGRMMTAMDCFVVSLLPKGAVIVRLDRTIQYVAASQFILRRPWNTGSSAAACHRAARCADPVADDDGGKVALIQSALTKKWPRLGGHFSTRYRLVVPVMATPDDDRSVAAMPVPAAVQPAIMSIELGTRAAEVIAVAIVVPVASDPEPETFSARYRRRCHRDGCQRGENARNLPHVASPLVARIKTIGAPRRSGNCPGTFLNGYSARLRIGNGSLRGATLRLAGELTMSARRGKAYKPHFPLNPSGHLLLHLPDAFCDEQVLVEIAQQTPADERRDQRAAAKDALAINPQAPAACIFLS